MLVTSIYNSADTYFVGKISTQAMAAVGLVFSVMAMLQAIGSFFGHGSGNFLSRKLGAGEYKEANEMASTGFALSILTGVINNQLRFQGNVMFAMGGLMFGAVANLIRM